MECPLCKSVFSRGDTCPNCRHWTFVEEPEKWFPPELKNFKEQIALRRKKEKIRFEKASKEKKTGLFKPNIEKLKNKRKIGRLAKKMKRGDLHIRELAAAALFELECWDELERAEKVKRCISCRSYGLKTPFSNYLPKDWHDVSDRIWSGPDYDHLYEQYTVMIVRNINGPRLPEGRFGIPENKHFLCPGCFEDAARKDDEIKKEVRRKEEEERKKEREEAQQKWEGKRSVISLKKNGPEDKKSAQVFQWLKEREGRRASISYTTNFSENLARHSKCILEAPEVPVGTLKLFYKIRGVGYLVLPLEKVLEVSEVRKNKLVITLYHGGGGLGDEDKSKWKDKDRYDFRDIPKEKYEIKILAGK